MRDDPFKPRDATVLRPRPGGNRPATPEAGKALGLDSVLAPQLAQSPPPSAMESGSDGFLANGKNCLLALSAPLLILGSRLQSTVSQADIDSLHRQCVQAVQEFDHRAQAAGISPKDTTIARYIICTFVDSAVFRTPWGAESNWAGRSLLSLFHKEVEGGAKFFQILDQMRQDPAQYLDLLELQYVCMALGFEGRYRNDRGRLVDLQDEVLRTLRTNSRGTIAALSPHWQGAPDPRRRVLELTPWWVVALACLLLLTVTWMVLRHQLSRAVAPVAQTLASQGVELGYAPVPAAAPGRLKPLLTPEEQAGKLVVEEFGQRSLVTLSGSQLFRSGSATLDPGYVEVVRQIGRAIEKVPGRVIVVGHTDDQPVHSFAFKDNFELSRERAVAVAQILRKEVSNPARIEWTGLGATQPRFTPANLAENRARNRRVEIVHQGEEGAR
jgi:type VI secretion system protein ImpK